MTVPIVPGNPQPEEPTRWQEIGPPMYEPYVPPAQPVTRQPQSYQPSETQATVKKAAVGTVTVIVTLVGLFCVLPLLLCFGMAACGALLPTPSTP